MAYAIKPNQTFVLKYISIWHHPACVNLKRHYTIIKRPY